MIQEDWIGVPVALAGFGMYVASYILVARIKTFDI